MTKPIAGLNCDGNVLFAAARLGCSFCMMVSVTRCSISCPALAGPALGVGTGAATTSGVTACCFDSLLISSSCFFIFCCSSPSCAFRARISRCNSSVVCPATPDMPRAVAATATSTAAVRRLPTLDCIDPLLTESTTTCPLRSGAPAAR